MSGSLIMPVILLVIQVGRADVDVSRPKVIVVAFLHFFKCILKLFYTFNIVASSHNFHHKLHVTVHPEQISTRFVVDVSDISGLANVYGPDHAMSFYTFNIVISSYRYHHKQ